MNNFDGIKAILERIVTQQEFTNDDIKALSDLHLNRRDNGWQVGKYDVTIHEGKGIQIGDNNQFVIHEGPGIEAIRQVLEQAYLSRRRTHAIKTILVTFSALILVGSVLALVKFLIIDPHTAPMPEGWNIAVAGIGVLNTEGIVQKDERGQALSERLYTSLQTDADHIIGWENWNVGSVTGDRENRLRKVKLIAQRTNADVVVYGVLYPTGPGRVEFSPEFYIQESPDRIVAVYGAEFLGDEQFGSPIEVSLDVDDNNKELTVRMSALRDFLNGLRELVNQRFEPSSEYFQKALEHIDTEAADPRTVAVIHLFLGVSAINMGSDNYHATLHHTEQAHRLWPEYPRPYITKAAVLYLLAQDASIHSASPFEPERECFDPGHQPSLSSRNYLFLALRCYDEALKVERTLNRTFETQPMDVESKVLFSQGSIYFQLSHQVSPEYWTDATDAFNQVIMRYKQATPNQQERLRELTARAYARRALIVVCYPDCDNPAPKTNDQYRQAVKDYEQAIVLLQSPTGCKDNMIHCYPDDVADMQTYRNQIENINQHLEEQTN